MVVVVALVVMVAALVSLGVGEHLRSLATVAAVFVIIGRWVVAAVVVVVVMVVAVVLVLFTAAVFGCALGAIATISSTCGSTGACCWWTARHLTYVFIGCGAWGGSCTAD